MSTVLLWIIGLIVGLVVLVLVIALIGGLLTFVPIKRTLRAFADEIDQIVELAEGRDPTVECADEVDIAFNQRIRNSKLESIRQDCLRLPKEYPPDHNFAFCGPEGIPKLKEYSRQLREMAS